LNELRESFGPKGFRILAITSEEKSVVEPWLAQNGVQYTVGIGGNAADGYGGGGIPHAYLVDPEGTVVWEGHPASLSDGDVEKLLRRTKDFYLRDVHGDLKEAARAFEKGQLVQARTLAQEIKDQASDEQIISDAQYVLNRVQATRDFWKRQANEGEAAGLYEQVFDSLEKLEKHFDGGPAGEEAAARLKELKADAQVKVELKACKELDRLRGDFADAGTSERKLDDVARKLERFLQKYEGTKTAARAQRLLQAVERAPRR